MKFFRGKKYRFLLALILISAVFIPTLLMAADLQTCDSTWWCRTFANGSSEFADLILSKQVEIMRCQPGIKPAIKFSEWSGQCQMKSHPAVILFNTHHERPRNLAYRRAMGGIPQRWAGSGPAAAPPCVPGVTETGGFAHGFRKVVAYASADGCGT